VSIGYRWASRALTRARVWQRACQALDHHVPTRTELGVQANYASCTIDPRRINWLSAQSRLHTQYSHGNKDEKNRTAKDEIFAAVRPEISVRSQPYAAREGELSLFMSAARASFGANHSLVFRIHKASFGTRMPITVSKRRDDLCELENCEAGRKFIVPDSRAVVGLST
jgi:hypothetical protein